MDKILWRRNQQNKAKQTQFLYQKLLDAAEGFFATCYFCLMASRISLLIRAEHQFWPHIEQ